MSQAISAGQVQTIIFACEAGMGSSLMSVNSLKKKLKAANLTHISVIHKPAREIPANAQLVIVHKGLAKVARAKAPHAVVLAFNHFLNDPIFDKLINKEDAIRQAGALLVQSGCVRPEYVDGMLAREQSMSTSLGNGVAIPHGIYENLAHILHTGISVLQLTQPILWEEDDEVSLVIGIAAASDEHVGVLANLADVIEDDANLAELISTTDPEVIIRFLGAS
jgi:mannitol/fructose-specific phosphotransferase system IIA component